MLLGLAPMDGITDLPFRIITKKIFDKYNNKDELMFWTEFMTSDGYLANPIGVISHIFTTEYDKPLIAQIFGGNLEKLVATIQDIQKRYPKDFCGIELNTGCPASNIMKSGGGASLLKDKKKLSKMIIKLYSICKLPLSIKTRTGLDNQDKSAQLEFLINISKYVNIISVHGRTLKDGYSNEPDRDFIAKLKRNISNKNCKIIGNGGIQSLNQAYRYNKKYNLDGIMIGQKAIGNPRIFTNHKPSFQEKFEIILEHLELSIKYEIYLKLLKESNKIPIQMPKTKDITNINIPKNYQKIYYTPFLFRKYLYQYIKGIKNSKLFKEEVSTIKDYDKLKKTILNFYTKKRL